MLPFGQESLPVELPQLRVTEPDRRHIRPGAAGVGCSVQADYTVFANVALRAFDTEFMQTLEIVRIDGQNGCAFFSLLEKSTE